MYSGFSGCFFHLFFFFTRCLFSFFPSLFLVLLTCTLNYVRSGKNHLLPFLEITLSLTNLNTRPAAHVSVAEPSLAPGPMQTHLSLNHLLSVDHTANYIEPDQRNR